VFICIVTQVFEVKHSLASCQGLCDAFAKRFDGSNDFNNWVSRFKRVAAINYWNDAKKYFGYKFMSLGKLTWFISNSVMRFEICMLCLRMDYRKRFEPASKAIRLHFKGAPTFRELGRFW